jgi:ATP-dependent DNA helicase RecQ
MNTGLQNKQNCYEVYRKGTEFFRHLGQLVRATDGPVIICAADYNAADQCALELQQQGISALCYHLGLTLEQQATCRRQFVSDQVQVIVSTEACVSTLNKIDVSLIVYDGLPRNLSDYWQLTSKIAARGKSARCILYFSHRDIQMNGPVSHRGYILSSTGNKDEKKKILSYLLSGDCRLSILAGKPDLQCCMCDNCQSKSTEVDWTIDAQKFLSCVARFSNLNQSYGCGYIIQILQGVNQKKIVDKKHHKLSTYGIGQDRSKEAWQVLSEVLLLRGLVDREVKGDLPVLRLNEKSWEILHKRRSVLFKASIAPGTLDRLPKNLNHRESVLDLYRSGLPLSEMASKRGISEQAILNQLSDLLLKGENIDLNRFVNPDEYQEISQTLGLIGLDSLRNVYDHLESRCCYGQIRLVIAHQKRTFLDQGKHISDDIDS